MGKAVSHMTMSSDGYIADPDDHVGELPTCPSPQVPGPSLMSVIEGRP